MLESSSRFCSLLLVALATACCAPLRPDDESGITVIRQRAIQAGLELADPLETTVRMQRAAIEGVGLQGTPVERLQRLARFLLDSTGLNFRYSSRRSLTAPDAFEAREGDCFAYANLFAAMARALRVPVHFVRLRSMRAFEEYGDSFFVEGHISVAYSDGAEAFVADIPGSVADGQLVMYEGISDREAATLFFSNRGADQIQAGDLAGAAKLLRFLTVVEPEVPEPWSNLGVVLLRQKRYRDALELLRRAIARFPEFQPLYANCALAADGAGDDGLARNLAAIGRRLAGDDPYLLFGRGLAELERQNFARAAALFKAAARIKPGNAVFHLWLASASLSAGDERVARAALQRARAIAPNLPMLRALESSRPDLAVTKHGGEHP
jgi:tetratricopeptide (TPR) repeat protein